MKSRLLVSTAALLIALALSSSVRAEDADPAALQLSRQLMDAMHVSASSDQMFKQMMNMMGNGLNAANPGKGKEIQGLLTDVLVPELSRIKPELIEATAHAYAANFSADELKQILAFYQSDIGRKLVDRLPMLLQEQGQAGQRIMLQAMPDIEAKLDDALAKRGLSRPRGN
jgi:hypothetical protein